jgi:SAM-dependent methyltransferase
MNRASISLFTCPECGSGELHLEEYVSNESAGQVIDGRLICARCRNWCRIENGVADLLPLRIKQLNHERFVVKDVRFSEKYGLPMPASDVTESNVPLNKTKPLGAFEDVVNYEKDVVENRFYKSLDQTAFIDWMSRYLKAGDLVLDIGCGSGRQCVPFAESGMQVVGLDVDEDMVLLAAKKLEERSLSHKVDIIVADGENPPVKENHFKACILYGVLHHLTEKDVAVLNASRKIVPGGWMYTLDPHKSFVRFIFDFFMRIWQLWVEEASEDPLITEDQINSWMVKGGVHGKTRLSTYLPPHIFLGGLRFNVGLLRLTDMIFSHIPGLRKAGGVIIFEGKKSE